MTEEVKMKERKKKGKVHYTKDKNKNPELVDLEGCKGCDRVCKQKCKAHPNIAKDTTRVKFGCNNLGKEEKRDN